MTPGFLAAVLLTAPSIQAGVTLVASEPWGLQTGISKGAGLELRWAWNHLTLFGRTRVELVSESDLAYRVDQLELSPGLGLGWFRALGRGSLSLSLVGSGVWVREIRERHQSARLEGTGLEDTSESWAGGVTLAVEGRFTVDIARDLRVGVEVGPSLGLVGSEPLRVGGSMAVVCALELGGGEE